MEAELELGDDAEVASTASHPQKRSTFSAALAFTSSPSAVMRSTPISWSIVSPCLRWSHPMPPPRVSPATPVCVTIPPVVASPNAWVS